MGTDDRPVKSQYGRFWAIFPFLCGRGHRIASENAPATAGIAAIVLLVGIREGKFGPTTSG
jgi:hypothetical protein